MKTELQKRLAALAPSVSIETIWQHAPDHLDIRKDVCGLEDEDPANWQAWISEIRACAIVGAQIVTHSAYLGGTWELAGDDPAKSNPEISGYEPHMTDEALRGLYTAAKEQGASAALLEEIDLAIDNVTRCPA